MFNFIIIMETNVFISQIFILKTFIENLNDYLEKPFNYKQNEIIRYSNYYEFTTKGNSLDMQ